MPAPTFPNRFWMDSQLQGAIGIDGLNYPTDAWPQGGKTDIDWVSWYAGVETATAVFLGQWGEEPAGETAAIIMAGANQNSIPAGCLTQINGVGYRGCMGDSCTTCVFNCSWEGPN